MPLESITKKIIEDAKAKAEEIIKKAQGEAEDILAQAEVQAEENFQQYLRREEEKFRAEANQILVGARLDKRNRILEEEHRQLDTLFDLLGEKISLRKKETKLIVTREGTKKETLPEEDFLSQIKERTSLAALKALGLER